MLTKDMHKEDIEQALEGKGDFTQIDYLNRYLKLNPPIEMRKFANLKLAEIYMKKEMFTDAGIAYRNAAINSIPFREKRRFYVEEAKAEILGLKFEKADKAMNRAFDEEASTNDRRQIFDEITKFYKEFGDKLLRQGKPGRAVKIYEKLYRMKIPDADRDMVKMKLTELYEKLGMRKELGFLRQEIKGSSQK